ncbi:hypothetical protein QMZ92_21485 [Streptomyces sp. HNM0645]|uniref:hypothetical protein n=1 Tax=Streptomyces sp. HNM0645 TaxID=2782343 RepID=UPI0024B81892|nr:hypothetical protein [Streptomyces sp. HNM0645]MDI9886869.1 hypothetical protein [Streptomyces sp. HNM0645]
MRITITEIVDARDRTVAFTGPCGSAWGHWHGASDPETGVYNIELDIPEPVTDWRLTSGPDRISGDYAEGKVRLRGTVQSVDDDGVVALRIDTDIVLIEAGRGSSGVNIGDSVEFETPDMHLYPYAL